MSLGACRATTSSALFLSKALFVAASAASRFFAVFTSTLVTGAPFASS